MWILFWLILGPLVGGMIGASRNAAGFGILLGLFGPIGWLLAFLNDNREVCNECRGRVPDGARRCQHCGVQFVVPVGTKQSVRDLENYKRWRQAHPAATSSWEQTVSSDDEVAKWAKQNGPEK